MLEVRRMMRIRVADSIMFLEDANTSHVTSRRALDHIGFIPRKQPYFTPLSNRLRIKISK
jgi:hypothetical protein